MRPSNTEMMASVILTLKHFGIYLGLRSCASIFILMLCAIQFSLIVHSLLNDFGYNN